MPRNLPDDFPDLPSFDARDFEPPAWAKQTYQRKGPSSEDGAFPAGGEDDVDEWSGPGSPKEAGVELEAPGTFRFTTEELKVGFKHGSQLTDAESPPARSVAEKHRQQALYCQPATAR